MLYDNIINDEDTNIDKNPTKSRYDTHVTLMV
jgi:hypothetical protein